MLRSYLILDFSVVTSDRVDEKSKKSLLKKCLTDEMDNMKTTEEVEFFRQAILDEDLDAMRRAIKSNNELVRAHVTEYRRAFCFACEQGKMAAAKLLVELGADPREDDDFAVTRTSLHHPEGSSLAHR